MLPTSVKFGIIALIRLCFLLLGDEPNHWRKRVVNKPQHYLLQGFRTAHFAQSRRQKVNLVLRNYAGDSNPELREQLISRARKMKSQEFLDWFRKTFPDKYFKLF